MNRSFRSRVGIWIAQAGGVLMILGGAADLSIRELLPNHRQLLTSGFEPVPPAAETLVLALLHALGAALIASGLAVLVLLRQAHRSGRVAPAIAAAGVALLAEGMNALGMYRTGSPLFLAPLSFLLLVFVGVGLYATSRVPATEGGPARAKGAMGGEPWPGRSNPE